MSAMKVNVCSFMNPLHHSGGGEMVTRALIEAGRRRGHEIRIASVRPFHCDKHKAPNLNLFVDIRNHGHSWRSLGAWRRFTESTLCEAAGSAPFVHLMTAYADVCNLPYLPCSGDRAGTQCPAKPNIGLAYRMILLRDIDTGCSASDEAFRWLHTRAALNVYLSPLHYQISARLLAMHDPPPSYLLPPMIDTTRFFNRGVTRDIEYLFVGVISEAKGLAAMRERFRDADIVLVGRCAPGVRVEFGTHIPHVPYEEVPLYMNRAKHFVFLPRWPEPQGRVVAEAALCGCKIIANENVGALSYPFDLADPANYVGVESKFWERIESIAA